MEGFLIIAISGAQALAVFGAFVAIVVCCFGLIAVAGFFLHKKRVMDANQQPVPKQTRRE